MYSMIRRLWLFARIVWREYDGHRLSSDTSWAVANIVWPNANVTNHEGQF